MVEPTPSEKYARQIGNLPQIGVKIKHIRNHQPDLIWQVNLQPKRIPPTSEIRNKALRAELLLVSLNEAGYETLTSEGGFMLGGVRLTSHYIYIYPIPVQLVGGSPR